MNTKANSQLRVPLRVHLTGAAVRRHRMVLPDLVLLCRQLQIAVERVGRVLLSQKSSSQPRPNPTAVKAACSLEIVGITGGSLTLVCDLLEQKQRPLFSGLGEEALESFVAGLERIGLDGEALPKGYDRDVLLALRETGKLFERGIDTLTFDLRTSKGQWSCSYTPQTHTRLLERIREPIGTRRTLEGRLLMGDFKETGFRCRLHPPVGKPVLCTFEEAQKNAVLAALTCHVRLTGEATESEGRIRQLRIERIEILNHGEAADHENRRRGMFLSGRTDLTALAAEQGVSSVRDFEDLLGNFWPEEESADDFVAAVQQWRREDNGGGSP